MKKFQEIDKVLGLYYDEFMSTYAIADKLKIHQTTVGRIINKHGSGLRNSGPTKRRDDLCFSTINEYSCYFAGFIMADGCISDEHELSISCHIQDIDILEKFKEFAKLSHRICFRDKVNVARISVTSRTICSDLEKFGVIPRKSLIASPALEHIPSQLQRHFWRGMVDGDGSLTKTAENYPSLQMCGSYGVMFQFRNLCSNLTGRSYKIGKDDNIYRVGLSGSSAVIVAKHLYKDSVIYLNRKYNKYLSWIAKSN